MAICGYITHKHHFVSTWIIWRQSRYKLDICLARISAWVTIGKSMGREWHRCIHGCRCLFKLHILPPNKTPMQVAPMGIALHLIVNMFNKTCNYYVIQ